MIEQRIDIDTIENALALFGSFDENAKSIEGNTACPSWAEAQTSR
jgi:hypothetical protein